VAALADPAAGLAAADGLVRLGSNAVEVLVPALPMLEDASFRTAARALGRIGSASALPHLLPYLHTGNAEEATAVAEALGQIGDAKAFEPLLELLQRPEAAVRQAAVGALSSIGHAALRDRLPELLDSPLAFVRESAARIAGYLGYRECMEQLLALCNDPEDSVRRAALEHLVYLNDPAVLGALREGLHATSATTRAAAVRAIARISPADATPLLQEALEDPDLWVRYYAARAAGSLELGVLSSALNEVARHDPAVPVRIAALESIGSVSPAGVSLLLEAIGDSDPEIRVAALVALARTAHPEAETLGKVLPAESPQNQRSVLEAMSPATAAILATEITATASTTPDPRVAEAAANALLRAESAPALRLLLSLAALPHLRPICVSVLSRSSADRIDLLAAELEGGDESAREAVVAALAHLDSPEAGKLAGIALTDPSELVRRAAEHTLLRIDLRGALAAS
jgi:HEAT repeat protein